MDEKKLQEQLDALKTALEKNLDEKAREQVKAAIASFEKQIDELKKQGEKVAELEKQLEKLKEDAAKNQKAFDDWQAKQKEIPTGQPAFKTFKSVLGEQLEAKKEALAKYKTGDAKGFAIEMKVVGDMSSSGSLTGNYFVAPTIVPGVTLQPFEEVHMRDMLPVGQTNSNVVRFVRDNGGEGGPATTAEGAAKPQMDRDLQIYDAPVRKIATHMRVPEEMIDDIPYLQSFLSQIGIEEVMSVEDDQILYGDGTGQNLKGLFHADNSTVFNPGTSVIQDANEFDVIRAARKQIRNAKLGGPLRAVVSPDDFFNMTSQKDTTNNYLFLGGGNGIPLANAGGSPTGINVGGVIIEEHTAITSGDFIVFQTRSAQIFDRSGTTVRFYDQDQDNAIKNLITIVIEKRLALAVYRPLGIIRGTFGAAVNDLANDSE
jgi:HK97 family phage major capsid protein